MNTIVKKPVETLGYGFIPKEYIPKGKNEYYLRNIQNRSGIHYRKLTAAEEEGLIKNGNSSDDWTKVLVSEGFNPSLVRNCKFYGLVRIGKLEPYYLEFNNLKMPTGLYNSTIVSCDFGDNVAINHVGFLSHYIIGNEVMLSNIHEMDTTNYAKFGNGVLKQGEKESLRIWIELCNENGGRSILPFNGILPGDAWLWSRYRDDDKLQQRFKELTENKFDNLRGYYGKIGDRTIIKNCGIIKDTWIGSDAYIKGANKIKNITINSSPEAKTQIGEGCELVNGIIGFDCRIFYGVKAVRFIMGSHSQLKYGARLINSYLGDNSTISCCEVLNSLIFPAHEQHHNNSFLCAATILGQTNVAAGATIGSNHNSRGADGEVVAGRGFWPGLCVSLKHNSIFASYTLLSKGDFPAELNIPIPFSLIINDVAKDELSIMPAYWFMYNMYALARNAGKYEARDKRLQKIQHLEYDILAPDTINEMFVGIQLLQIAVARAWAKKNGKKLTEKEWQKKGKALLDADTNIIEELDVLAEGFENTKRNVRIIKVKQAYTIFKQLIVYFGMIELLSLIENKNIHSVAAIQSLLPKKTERLEWENIGGQLIPKKQLTTLLNKIKTSKISDWDQVHDFYNEQSQLYPKQRQQFALSALLEILAITPNQFTPKLFGKLLDTTLATKEWITENIYQSRAKDYTNPFRKMVYSSDKEMDNVIGKLADNSFINNQLAGLKTFEEKIKQLRKLTIGS